MHPPKLPRLALAGAAGLLALAPSAADACSVASFTPWRDSATAVLVGTASADTVLAGAGPVRYTLAAGHHGPGYGQARPVHGQIVAIERLDARTRAMLPAGATRVVLVPWDYGPDCRPVLWAKSFRWTTPGEGGLYMGALRDRAHWAGGVPTLDVRFMTTWFPYPGRTPTWREPNAPLPALTAEELLGLYEVLPTREEKDRDYPAAIEPVIAWARRHPDLARRWPAAGTLWSMRAEEAQWRVRTIRSPLTGTYRLAVSLDGAAPRTLWVRTMGRPSSGEPPRRTASVDVAADPLVPQRSVAYGITLSGDTTLAGLPEAADPYRLERIGYLRVELPGGADSSATMWQGAVEIAVLGRVFPADSALRSFVRTEFEVYGQRRRAGLPQPTQATFTRTAHGGMRIEQRTELPDGRTLVLRGERVSTDVIRELPPTAR